MAKKRRLSDLIGEETQQPDLATLEQVDSQATEVSELVSNEVTDSQTDKVSDIQSHKPRNSKTNKVTELQTTKVTDSRSTVVPNSQSTEVSESKAYEVPKYLTLVRKEARLRSDQLDNLTSLTRSLNRQRKGSGERITENTLIRVAVDLLMNQSSELNGTTEQELGASVGLD